MGGKLRSHLSVFDMFIELITDAELYSTHWDFRA